MADQLRYATAAVDNSPELLAIADALTARTGRPRNIPFRALLIACCLHARVEPTNITTQSYLQRDLGQRKLEATAVQIHEIDPTITVTPIADRWRPEHPTGEAVFCCVDTISARAAIWRSLQHRCQFWCDSRMRGEVIRVLTAHDSDARGYYRSTLFPQSESQAGPCTARSTIYTASIASGLMIHQFSRWMREISCDRNLTFNLLASELLIKEALV